MADVATTVFGIHELCDHIVHHIALDDSSQGTLKSTALVCQTLCISAQCEIFRHVELDVYQLQDGNISSSESATPACILVLGRLSAILAASPHLLRHVRSLSVLARSEILEPVLSIGFPLLQKIRFNFWGAPQPIDDLFHLTRDCIALPSIREVELANLYKRRLSMDPLFEARGQYLDSLTFNAVRPLHPISTACTPCPQERRTHIKHLKLLRSEKLEDWMISPSCPFDFTRLVDVEAHGRPNSVLLQLLSSARMSIKQLRIGDGVALGLNLAEFPALTLFETNHSNCAVISSLNADNCVETLVLRIGNFGWEDMKSKSALAADSVIANCPMPALRQVEVLICGASNYDWHVEFQLEWVKPCFPQLASRGLLLVRDNRYRDPFKGT
ncbi:hypothetical protein FB451DRAFT_735715 [Mycena latifolia]|nr:hypothetical protein FB451DRAFT_735715 [Mycena latifolia]